MCTVLKGLKAGVLLILAAAMGPITPAIAQEESGAAPAEATVDIDLNRLEQLDRGCRIDLVITNGTETGLNRFEVDWVFFDQDGVISNRTALELAPMPAGRTSVKQFVIDAIECGGISSALINGVNHCEGSDGVVEGCLDLVSVSSRAGVSLRQ